jgi:hypothetical protein
MWRVRRDERRKKKGERCIRNENRHNADTDRRERKKRRRKRGKESKKNRQTHPRS